MSCLQHNFIGLNFCEDSSTGIFSGSDNTAITLKGIPKRMKIFFTKDGIPFNPEIINLSVDDESGRTVFNGSFSGGQIKKEEDGSFYVDLPLDFFSFAPKHYIFKWTYQERADSEICLGVSYLYVVNVSVYDWFPRLRLQLDKSMKIVNHNFVGFTDAQLYYYLQGGLDEINLFPPVTSFILDNYPRKYGQLLIDAATIVGLHSQKLFSVDTDIQSFSDQGFSYTVDHFSRLNTVLNNLLTNIKDQLRIFKLEFYGGGSITVQVVPYYPLAVLLKTAAPGTLFRNLFVGG